MNVKRYTARSSRDALALARQDLGQEAVVLSTKPCAEGIEVLAMASEGLQQLEQAAESLPSMRSPEAGESAAPLASAAAAASAATAKLKGRVAAMAHDLRESLANGSAKARAVGAPRRLLAALEPQMSERASLLRLEPQFDMPSMPAAAQIEPTVAADAAPADAPVEADVQQLSMSTLSFQDYVRERMHKRRQAAKAEPGPEVNEGGAAEPQARAAAQAPASEPPQASCAAAQSTQPAWPGTSAAATKPARSKAAAPKATRQRSDPPVLSDEVAVGARVIRLAGNPSAAASAGTPARAERSDMLDELRSMKHLIEERFGALAFMEKLQRSPRQAQLSQRLLEAGFSPAVVRQFAAMLPEDASDEMQWAADVLQANLLADDGQPPIEDTPGVYAMIGSTGVGKTTGTAKIAANYATRHGAGGLGLITLDAYRLAAHEQLRAYGRILGVTVHTAHDRASLEDLLGLLSGKQMILIDTAGMAQRDARTRELLDMLRHKSIQKLLVVNAAQQGESIEDTLTAWRVDACRGVILSKLDEAVKLAPALDALMRHKTRVLGVANGQRVPEDWHHLSAQALVQRALRGGGTAAWRMDASEVNLVFAGVQQLAAPRVQPA